MQACCQGIITSKDQSGDNCIKGNVCLITPGFDALSYLSEYFFELSELFV